MRTSICLPPAHGDASPSRDVTIVMYHYVRPLERSRFPRLRALDLDRFRSQLDHLLRHHTPVSMEDVVTAGWESAPLPPNPVLLTFDDGFADHYRYVFPLLHARGVRGAFFPPACAVLERRMLDVHKIHCLLATVENHDRLAADMERLMEEAHRADPTVVALPAACRERWYRGDGLDTAVVVYLKSMMQHALPASHRGRIVDSLFRIHVSADETAMAEEYYVDLDQLRVMMDNGMHVGGHGNHHLWHSRISTADKTAEIEGSLRLLGRLGLADGPWTYCYPNGDYDAETIGLLRARGCVAALIVGDDRARLDGPDKLMELPRLDTTRFPTDATAPAGLL